MGYNGYVNPYYELDDHPLLYGNNGSLDPLTYIYLVGGFNFNPFEKYAQVKLDHETPRIAVKIPKNIWVTTTYLDVPGS